MGTSSVRRFPVRPSASTRVESYSSPALGCAIAIWGAIRISRWPRGIWHDSTPTVAPS